MISEAFSFYWAWLKRAFAGWFKRVEGWASTLALLIPAGLQLANLPPQWKEGARDLPTWLFLGVSGAIVTARLLVAPFLLFRDERTVRLSLERARVPTLALFLPEPPVLNSVSLQGTTHESLSGRRQTVITQAEFDVVSLHCRNEGEHTASDCKARLMSVTKIAAATEERLEVISPVLLPWEKEEPEENLSADLAPGEIKRIWVGGVRNGGQVWIFRDPKRLPIEYRQLLGEQGTYRVLIQVDGDGIPAQRVELEITAKERDQAEPGIRRGHAEAAPVAPGSTDFEHES
jgi:hypothetical protein